jgi:hypothetical protein
MMDALTELERRTLAGEVLEFPTLAFGILERLKGLRALALGEDLAAVASFSRSLEALPPGSLERAISQRCYGLALIRVQREVEGTFALERSDPILERYGFHFFDLNDE